LHQDRRGEASRFFPAGRFISAHMVCSNKRSWPDIIRYRMQAYLPVFIDRSGSALKRHVPLHIISVEGGTVSPQLLWISLLIIPEQQG
jgi:hypothetical protein